MTINQISNASYTHQKKSIQIGNDPKKLLFKPAQIPSEESIRLASKEIKKLYTDPLDIPNFFSLFQLPFDAARYYKALAEAHFHREKESILEAKLKLCKTGVNAAYSFASIANILTVSHQLASFGKTSFPIIGSIAAPIAGGIEAKCIRRQAYFISRCKKIRERIEKDPQDLEAYSFLQQFLGTSSEINKIQLSRLSQRVKPWFAEKLALELPEALEKGDMKKASLLLKNTIIQAEKKMIQHTFSLLCNMLIFTACISLIVGAPYTIPLIIFVGVSVIYFANYFFGNGTDQIGWKFNLEYCIPFWKKNHNG